MPESADLFSERECVAQSRPPRQPTPADLLCQPPPTESYRCRHRIADLQ